MPARGLIHAKCDNVRVCENPREVGSVIKQSERTARSVTTVLARKGIIIIIAAGPRDEGQISCPAKLAPRLMPGLFFRKGQCARPAYTFTDIEAWLANGIKPTCCTSVCKGAAVMATLPNCVPCVGRRPCALVGYTESISFIY